MWVGDQGCVFLFVVVVGQGNAVRDFDADDKSRWY